MTDAKLRKTNISVFTYIQALEVKTVMSTDLTLEDRHREKSWDQVGWVHSDGVY